MSVWTDEKVAELQKLVSKGGLSCSQMGARLGVSRNAIIGKVHRTGLRVPRMPKKDSGMLPPSRQQGSDFGRKRVLTPRNPIKQMRQPAAKTRVSPALPDVPPSEPVLVAPHLLGILDLLPHHCRFPLNDAAPFYFCGAQKADGSPYCSEHHARAFVKPVRTKQPFAFRRLAA